MDGHKVAVVCRPGLGYGRRPPFDPPQPVAEAVEAVFRALGLDAERAGTAAWNPLGELIEPGARVVVKPNLVSSRDRHARILGDDLEASSTHGSLLRVVLDYALRATGPGGRVTVVDAPVEGCDIDEVAGPLGIYAVVDHLGRQGQPVGFVDLRSFRVVPWLVLDDLRRAGRSWNLGLLIRRALGGDPAGYRVVDLGEASFFCGAGAPPGERLRFHRSHYRTPVRHHTGGRHEYSLGQTVLDADVVINLPKLKTHKKAGVTLALKNAVGLSNEKYWLPHFSEGDPSVGGDELDRRPRLGERLARKLSRLPLGKRHSIIARAPRLDAEPEVIDGSWQGNDTLWRTVLDLNRILLFADRHGRLHETPVRRYLSIVDGIVAGEGEGPLGASPRRAGLLVGGVDPCLVDCVAAELMGFAPSAIPTIARALEARLLPTSDASAIQRVVDGPLPSGRFKPPRSWPSLAPGGEEELS